MGQSILYGNRVVRYGEDYVVNALKSTVKATQPQVKFGSAGAWIFLRIFPSLFGPCARNSREKALYWHCERFRASYTVATTRQGFIPV
ncbi:hypothetical protein TNCV_640451 [Trichonephila clavipes]|nr:hypothetical protein TNCV_640451 [Trichonephila clavipes]